MLQSEVALAGLVRNLVLPVGLAIALPMVIANSALAERRPGDGQLASRSEPVTVLELSRSAKRVRVIRDNQEVAAFPVAVGKSSTPTPLGEHTVFRMQKDPVWVSPWTDRKVSPSPLGPIGTRWIGFWYACGNRTSLDLNPPAYKPEVCKEIGFHGTGRLASIGTAASNGCVRMVDRDAVALYELVKEGTRVRVVD
ncbi:MULTISPECIES: L,D-transpeptidase [Synechococcus]|uniref:L,D-transpeptidase n=1 Tax=Synechococcus TaxID=1129 RepID=UPI0020CFD2F5|nr:MULTISPECIES: L,D-transpeptidase [Synechococcus]MCF8134312.1 L,D-transpeptidase [Synechococcus lacustris]MCP9921677.1 L,D-transpeptidase [Synechococcus lacustris Cruz CV12-2]MCP9924378.1 L,D-transpeptidase [Synechococcus lacustris C3-12m-Tous]